MEGTCTPPRWSIWWGMINPARSPKISPYFPLQWIHRRATAFFWPQHLRTFSTCPFQRKRTRTKAANSWEFALISSRRLKSLWFMANCLTSAHFLPVIAVLLGTDWIESGCHRILHSEFRGSSLCPRVLLGALRVGHWMHSKWGLGGILPGASIFHAQSRDHGTNLELMTGKPVIIYNIMGLTTCRLNRRGLPKQTMFLSSWPLGGCWGGGGVGGVGGGGGVGGYVGGGGGGGWGGGDVNVHCDCYVLLDFRTYIMLRYVGGVGGWGGC